MADHRIAIAGVLAGLAMAGVLMAAAALTLGPPDPGLAWRFLSGSYPSMPSAVAFLSLLCYALVLGAAAVAVVKGVRAAAGRRGAGRTARAIAFVLAGVVLLGLSLASRVDGGGGICCGGGAQQVQEAASLAR